MLNRLLEHHILANLTFLLVMVIGWTAYFQLPREQDPSVNFNWVEILTHWPGAAAKDVEKRVTDPLEDGLKRIRDVRFVSSVSREGTSSILVRFEDISARDFDNRLADLRREVVAKAKELPGDAHQSEIVEITSANAFPTTALVASAATDGIVLQREAQQIRKDLERLEGVNRVVAVGASDPELRVEFHWDRLVGVGVSPVDLADSISAYFRDLAAGRVVIGDQRWIVRLAGTTNNPAVLEKFPIVTAEGEIPLRAVADVTEGTAEPQHRVRYQGRPGVLFWIAKDEKVNNIELLARVNEYIEDRNRFTGSTGIRLALLDDQTESTRTAIQVMENNALIGLALVIITVGIFLGLRTALIASVGIPFVLAGVFLIVLLIGETLNTTVLLAVVISLGMLVDDAVVVGEGIQFHLAQGRKPIEAARLALSEVALPVTTAVFTTIAAFLPLVLMPGVLGDFMRIVPLVVTIALLLSLLEAFWILPSHMVSFSPRRGHVSRMGRSTSKVIRSIKRRYIAALVFVLRRPWRAMLLGTLSLVLAGLALASGVVKVDFFATDFYRLFYVSVEMPAGTTLDKTLEATLRVERVVKAEVEQETRSIIAYAGQQITERELLLGDERGQIFISLSPDSKKTVEEIIERLQSKLGQVPGPSAISFVRRKTGPPTISPISIKVRGNDIVEIRDAVSALKQILRDTPGVSGITDDDSQGGHELLVRLNPDVITRAGLHPEHVARLLRLFATGEQVADMQYQGEKLQVRLLASSDSLSDINEYLNHRVSLPAGGEIALGELLVVEHKRSESHIRHQDFRRAVTVDAGLDPAVTDTLRANRMVQEAWDAVATSYPGITLDFSGELDDIHESLGSMLMLFLLGVGLIYLILGTQFRSYTQPLIVLAAVPMAFVGVVLGLSVSGNPLSLFTLYGVVALAGIAANDAIVLVATANRLRARGAMPGFAVAYAAKRRFLPIIVTSSTTIAGLYSLAAGLGGHSLMWAPVATAIVWGLAFSTVLTLLIIPVLYLLGVASRGQSRPALGLPPVPPARTQTWKSPLRGLLMYALSPAERHARRELEAVLQDEELRMTYEEGIEALRMGDLELAIRNFERLAAEAQDSLELNILAAQANLRFIQSYGWDVGYVGRARRYAMRARASAKDDWRVAMLLRALEEADELRDSG